MPKKPEAAEAPEIKFIQIAAASDGGLYALDEQGRVFSYDDGDEQGWFQLTYDETRGLAEVE